MYLISGMSAFYLDLSSLTHSSVPYKESTGSKERRGTCLSTVLIELGKLSSFLGLGSTPQKVL